MLTVIGCLVAAAFVSTLLSAWGKCPLWVGVLFLCVIELVRVLPIGK